MAKKSKKIEDVSPSGWIYLFLFFLSGFAGLCYQVVWIRELSVIFGKTNAAVTTVVSVFMLGLGLGSIYWGKKRILPGTLSRTFSFLQFGIGGGSLILLVIFPYLSVIFKNLVNLLGLSDTSILMVIFLLCGIIMFIPTFLMGGTFPVISQLYIRKDSSMGKGVGYLYGVNTFGGILGASLTGYFLIGWIGQKESHLVAILINLVIGGIFIFLKDRRGDIEVSEDQNSLNKPNKDKKNRKYKGETVQSNENPSFIRLLLPAAFLTGFAGLAYEILWNRALATFTSNSIYSFSSILVMYLTGIGFGSYIYGKYLSSKNGGLTLLVILQVILFTLVSLTAVFLNDIPILLVPFKGLMNVPLLSIIFPGLFFSFIMMFLPAVLMGMVFPLMCSIYAGSSDGVRLGIGKIYFYNTLGSMLGSGVAGFILIPTIGVIKSLLIISLINLFLAIFGSFYFEKRMKWGKRLWISIGVVCIFILIPYVMGKSTDVLPPSVFRNPNNPQQLKYYKETSEGTVVVVEDTNTQIRSCYVNNSAVCGTTYDALKVVHYMGHLPLVFRPDAKNALVIGFGIGVTTSAVAQHPLDSIDCVEICPGVKESAPLFEIFNRGVWKDDRINFIGGDGRNYLLLTRKTYDIISCDPVHPTLGSGSLYTREYFELCKSHLNPRGIISQYLPLHKLTANDLKTLLNTFNSVFPGSMVWLAQTHGVLIGSNEELHLSFGDILGALDKIDDPFFKDPYLISSNLMMNKSGIQAFLGHFSKVDTDNHSILEYFSPDSIQAKHHIENIMELFRYRQDPLQMISDVADPYLLDQYVKAQLPYIQGILLLGQGRRGEAAGLFRQAISINPQNFEIRLFLQ